jgi:endonuclease YncB( thermonuclease family)
MFEYYCKVNRVVDGDTIDVTVDLGFDIHHSARVRMMGIDTPESRTRNLAEKALGLASKARLKELLKGQKVKIATSKEGKGKFGRILADILVVDKKAMKPTSITNSLKRVTLAPILVAQKFRGSKDATQEGQQQEVSEQEHKDPKE